MTAWQPGPAWLFCPADRPDRYAKAAGRADVVIIDLEDAVAPDRKAQARADLTAYGDCDPERTLVRVNPAGTADHERDLEALARNQIRRVMLAKTELPEDVTGLSGYDVVALFETPRGIVRAAEIMRVPHVVGAMWGAEDLVAAMGGTSSRDAVGAYRPYAVHAQSVALLAAKAEGKLAIDAVHLDIPDLDGLRAETATAAASGFDAKALIHPGHVGVVREVYAPTPERVAWAERVLAGVAEHGAGVFSLDGQMVDGPVVAQARRVLGWVAN
ncbi:CoA ester lyase [Nostocoides vanveenii]|jgi:citrate lyase subunit beta/citryl-CoA lyase|uniref:Citrate (Pro-3S)-lyase subunit beta n=1 Tax=Nostocoides vanveenii TaxID=330835 RepID=A0ABP4WF81_9MICO